MFRAIIADQRRAEEELLRQQQEVVAKRREKRALVIEETLQTERDFLRSISVCHDVFYDTSQGHATPVSRTCPKHCSVIVFLGFGPIV